MLLQTCALIVLLHSAVVQLGDRHETPGRSAVLLVVFRPLLGLYEGIEAIGDYAISTARDFRELLNLTAATSESEDT